MTRIRRRRNGMQGNRKRTRRARLKGWRLTPPNTLSARRIFGALCKGLWRSDPSEALMPLEMSRAPAGAGGCVGV